MNELIEALRRLGAWLVALALGAAGVLVIARLLLPQVAEAVTALIATPGGILLIVIWWKWTHRRSS